MKRKKRWKFGFVFAWYDLWVGFYYDRKKKRLYCMLTMLGFYVEKIKRRRFATRPGAKKCSCGSDVPKLGHTVKQHAEPPTLRVPADE